MSSSATRAAATGDVVPAAPHAPRRVLIVSADIGGGHHATGRALEAAVRNRWPDATVAWVDTLEVMRVGAAFRGIYRTNVESTPWLYDFFYDRIDRWRWFARSSKAVTSAWAGRSLRPVLDRVAPDLVLSTYPIGSGGLAWLRRRGELNVPVGAWVADFAPHPFWVYEALDLHIVMHRTCVDLAERAEPGAQVRPPAALPVLPAFAPGDKAEARAALGLQRDPFTVLVSCGVYAFGAVEEAVDVLLRVGGRRVQVVVACGRNDALRRTLHRHPDAGHRLVLLGWTDRMPEVTRAADVVVTNAGGATVLEALATARPVLMFRPIAGHGRGNAAAMAAAGVTVLCRDENELGEALRRLLDDDAYRARLEKEATAATGEGELVSDIERVLAAGPGASPAGTTPGRSAHRALSGTDEFFALVDSARVPQHVAALALLRPPNGTPVTAEPVRRALADTVPIRPWLTWRLERPHGRRPRWRTGDGGGALPDVRLPVFDAPPEDGEAMAAFSQFIARPLAPDAPPWEIQMDPRWPDGRTAMRIRAHHAFGDGLAVLDAFTGITTSQPTPTPAPPLTPRAPVRPPRRGGKPVPRRRAAVEQARLLVKGLLSLAGAGAAPSTPLRAPRSGELPAQHAFTTLPAPDVRAAARAKELSTSDLLVAVVAEAVHRFLAERGTPAPRGTVRATVPRTLRATGAVDGPGNRTVALRVDLPAGPMPAAERVRRVRHTIAAAIEQGQPHATGAILWLAARLPVPLYRRFAAAVYRSTWFDMIISVIPGPRSMRWFGPARVDEAYAVLPLAEGVGLAVGIMSWADVLTVSVSYDPVLLPDGARLAELMRPAFAAVDAP
jgi:diacylglycerol O-acyltransferase